MACEYLSRCRFFRRFGERQSNVWKGIVGFYCTGNGIRSCEGRKILKGGGDFMGEQLLPTGTAISKAFFELP
jgi:hypothetical protein